MNQTQWIIFENTTRMYIFVQILMTNHFVSLIPRQISCVYFENRVFSSISLQSYETSFTFHKKSNFSCKPWSIQTSALFAKKKWNQIKCHMKKLDAHQCSKMIMADRCLKSMNLKWLRPMAILNKLTQTCLLKSFAISHFHWYHSEMNFIPISMQFQW